ncbi:hypothetical protein KBX73_14935 [Acetobacter persici]|uniref:hypothetical protein n=1 Tax=Acetobacter persici TaxID=1076596 RepID=UPI001BA85DC1|nr:hypothetical protein [Acetobacter persici]MBS1016872.1 hypothetical protein [Acetobacter persici]MCP9321039.1 hypothetical protein [Acetobacter persici]
MTHHWKTNFTENEILESEGFVYQVTNLKDGTKYIGKKFIWSKRKIRQKGTTRRKHIKSESNWRTYTSSSKILNADIDKLGKSSFLFEILSIHKTRSDTNYRELYLQVMNDVLNLKDNKGNYAFYNMNIMCKFFR